jgi:hypothetical protein
MSLFPALERVWSTDSSLTAVMILLFIHFFAISLHRQNPVARYIRISEEHETASGILWSDQRIGPWFGEGHISEGREIYQHRITGIIDAGTQHDLLSSVDSVKRESSTRLIQWIHGAYLFSAGRRPPIIFTLTFLRLALLRSAD